jgi:hypothetical protein
VEGKACLHIEDRTGTFSQWGRRPRDALRIKAISAGMGEIYPSSALPRDGPVPLRRTGVRSPLSGGRQERVSSLRGPRIRPISLNSQVLHNLLRRFRLFAAVHPTHSASVLGAFVKVRNANSTRAAHRRALSVRMAFSHFAHRGWTSARLAGAPSGSALAALLPFVVRSRQTADGRRERADSCR